MNRDTENSLLLLVGICTALITFTGSYMRYVKPSLAPYLAAAAILLIILAVVAMVRDIRHDAEHNDDDPARDDGHEHRSGVVWLLIVPVIMLGFIVPPAITPRAAAPSVTEVSTDVLRRPYPPLPNERAPALALPEVLIRIGRDSANTLDGRLITVTGFTFKEDGRTDLAKTVLICCAADATLAQIQVRGPAAQDIADYPDHTWLRVEAKVPAGQEFSRATIDSPPPVMEVFTATPIEPPANPYGD